MLQKTLYALLLSATLSFAGLNTAEAPLDAESKAWMQNQSPKALAKAFVDESYGDMKFPVKIDNITNFVQANAFGDSVMLKFTTDTTSFKHIIQDPKKINVMFQKIYNTAQSTICSDAYARFMVDQKNISFVYTYVDKETHKIIKTFTVEKGDCQ